ncbi:MAG: hypothetical protein IH614_16140 [Desulfuromonadales bacterium]|nr:hypothetical protein [Desulfuromonadales bacterium]
MDLDVVRFRSSLAEECALAVSHFTLRPNEKSRTEALLILDGIYHGVYALVQACRGEGKQQLLEIAREITLREQHQLQNHPGRPDRTAMVVTSTTEGRVRPRQDIG